MRDITLRVEAKWDNLDQAFRSLESELTKIVRGITVEAWDSILARTPQFYGRMVASYQYSLNIPEFYDRSWAVPMPKSENNFEDFVPASKGDQEAISLANWFNRGNATGFKLGDTVWISNGVDHGEGGYSGAIENGSIRLRSVNRPGTPARRSIDRLGVKYGVNVSPARAAVLKSLLIRG